MCECLPDLTFQRALHSRRHRRRKLLSQHPAIDIRTRAAAEQSVFRIDAVFHRFEHHFREHALNLLRDLLRIEVLKAGPDSSGARYAHMISSSACSAPAAFNASRIAIVSRCVTPNAFSARIKSSTVAFLFNVTKLLFCSWAVTFWSGVTSVC